MTSRPVRLTKAQKTAKLDELFGRVIAEAKAWGITQKDLIDHIQERMQDDE